jgi:hypothetical protein
MASYCFGKIRPLLFAVFFIPRRPSVRGECHMTYLKKSIVYVLIFTQKIISVNDIYNDNEKKKEMNALKERYKHMYYV